MTVKTFAFCLLALTVTTTACERKRVREPQKSTAVANNAKPGKPVMANLHKPEECPSMMDGEWISASGEKLTIGKDAEGQLTVTALDEKTPLPINGYARFTDTEMSYAYCAGNKLIYAFESGPSAAEPNRRIDITLTTTDLLLGNIDIQITDIGPKRKVEKLGEVRTIQVGRPVVSK